MGFDIHSARLLMLAKREGADFSDTITLGRQWLRVEPSRLRQLLQEMQIELEGKWLEEIAATAPFADGLLRALGARNVASVDVATYESASIIHDMNLKLPDRLAGQFTLLIDCGTLEHIFDFPNAMRNCMTLLRVGGRMVIAAPANNYMGHGFYQFSPELFYRVLAPENGFRVMHMYMSEARPSGAWYEINDPASLGRRVELVNSEPTYLLILAEKTSNAIPFQNIPQQSDYAQGSWQTSASAEVAQPSRLRTIAREAAPDWLLDCRAFVSRVFRSPFGAACFKRVDTRSLKRLLHD